MSTRITNDLFHVNNLGEVKEISSYCSRFAPKMDFPVPTLGTYLEYHNNEYTDNDDFSSKMVVSIYKNGKFLGNGFYPKDNMPYIIKEELGKYAAFEVIEKEWRKISCAGGWVSSDENSLHLIHSEDGDTYIKVYDIEEAKKLLDYKDSYEDF